MSRCSNLSKLLCAKDHARTELLLHITLFLASPSGYSYEKTHQALDKYLTAFFDVDDRLRGKKVK